MAPEIFLQKEIKIFSHPITVVIDILTQLKVSFYSHHYVKIMVVSISAASLYYLIMDC